MHQTKVGCCVKKGGCHPRSCLCVVVVIVFVVILIVVIIVIIVEITPPPLLGMHLTMSLVVA